MSFAVVLILVSFLTVFIAWFLLRLILRSPSRRYEGPESVANIYDAWSSDRVMEHYWGEHLHAGYYDKYNTLVDTVLLVAYRKTGFEEVSY